MRAPIQRQQQQNPFGDFVAAPAASNPYVMDAAKRGAALLSAPWMQQQAQERADALKAQQDASSQQQRGAAQQGDPNYQNSIGGYGGPNGGPGNGGNRSAIRGDQSDELLLARTLQAEAGNQGYEGMLDVGSVIANRVADKRYGDGTLNGVIMRRGQFSTWNGVTGYAGGEQGQDMNFQPNAQATKAAQAIIAGNYQDRTRGATHYVNKNISNPTWGNSATYKRGDHWFGQADGPGTGQRPILPQNGGGRAPNYTDIFSNYSMGRTQ